MFAWFTPRAAGDSLGLGLLESRAAGTGLVPPGGKREDERQPCISPLLPQIFLRRFGPFWGKETQVRGLEAEGGGMPRSGSPKARRLGQSPAPREAPSWEGRLASRPPPWHFPFRCPGFSASLPGCPPPSEGICLRRCLYDRTRGTEFSVPPAVQLLLLLEVPAATGTPRCSVLSAHLSAGDPALPWPSRDSRT